MQRAALLTRQPSPNLSYINLTPVLADVAQSPSLAVAEAKIRTAFYWLKDLRSHPEFHRLEKQLNDACCGAASSTRTLSRQSTTDLAAIRGGAFVLYCVLCPLPLLSKKLQDDQWLLKFEGVLRASKYRRLACEAILSLTHLAGCDSRKALSRMVLTLSELPEGNLVADMVARAASELILTSTDALDDEAICVASEVVEDTLDNGPLSLQSLHHSFKFIRVLMWAACGAGERFEGQVAESLLVLLPFTHSRSMGLRCLAVAALTSLAMTDGPFDRYMTTQAGTCPLGAQGQLAGPLASASWSGMDDSPFAPFLAAFPTSDRYRRVMSQFYQGPSTDWRSLAFALVEIIEEPNSLSAQGLETNEDDLETHYPSFEDINHMLVEAMDCSLDPEAATILRLRAVLAKGTYTEALAQARKAVQDHPACAFAHCVLGLFPDHVEGLKAAKKGLMCVSDDASPMLRCWLLWRAIVHAGLQGLALASGTSGDEGLRDAASLGAALIESALEDAGILLRANGNENESFAAKEQLLIWYILLSVALHGPHLSDSVMTLLRDYGLNLSPEKQDECWLQLTPYNDLDACRRPKDWSSTVDRIDTHIANTMSHRKHATAGRCLWCRIPTTVVVSDAYCDEGCKAAHAKAESARF